MLTPRHSTVDWHTDSDEEAKPIWEEEEEKDPFELTEAQMAKEALYKAQLTKYNTFGKQGGVKVWGQEKRPPAKKMRAQRQESAVDTPHKQPRRKRASFAGVGLGSFIGLFILSTVLTSH